jgi:hypothetical protein
MPKEIRLWRDLSAKIEPAEASAFPAASLLERSVNPVYGTAGLVSESKIGKISYREDSLQLAAGWSSFTSGSIDVQIASLLQRTKYYEKIGRIKLL